MLQAKLTKIRNIELSEVPALAEPKPGWATVETKAIGICGSEMHVYVGKNPVLSPPRIQGHEFSGVIKALNGDSDFKPGDRVTVNPVVSCGKCDMCLNNKRYLCNDAYVIGGEVTGAFAGEVFVPIRNLVPVDGSVSFSAATLIEPTAVAVHTVGDLRNKTVLIIGQGTIGLLCLQIAKSQGNKVITMDLSDTVLAVSQKLGSDLAINSGAADTKRQLVDFQKDNGPLDVAIDAVCNPATANFAVENVKKGGMIMWVGIPAGPFAFDLVTMLCKEIRLHTSYLYSEDDFLRARNLVHDGTINTAALISKKFPFTDTAKAFEYKLNTPSIKVVVEK